MRRGGLTSYHCWIQGMYKTLIANAEFPTWISTHCKCHICVLLVWIKSCYHLDTHNTALPLGVMMCIWCVNYLQYASLPPKFTWPVLLECSSTMLGNCVKLHPFFFAQNWSTSWHQVIIKNKNYHIIADTASSMNFRLILFLTYLLFF